VIVIEIVIEIVIVIVFVMVMVIVNVIVIVIVIVIVFVIESEIEFVIEFEIEFVIDCVVVNVIDFDCDCDCDCDLITGGSCLKSPRNTITLPPNSTSVCMSCRKLLSTVSAIEQLTMLTSSQKITDTADSLRLNSWLQLQYEWSSQVNGIFKAWWAVCPLGSSVDAKQLAATHKDFNPASFNALTALWTKKVFPVPAGAKIVTTFAAIALRCAIISSLSNACRCSSDNGKLSSSSQR